MQDHNPYAAPEANLVGKETYNQPGGGVTQGVVDQLARTKGWTRFTAVLLIIAASLILIGVFAGGAMATSVARNIRGGVSTAFVFGFLAVYVIMAVLYMVAGLKLNGFSSAVQRLLFSGREEDLEKALDRQRSFWLYCGILGIIGLIFMILGIFGALTSPMARF